MAFGEPEYPDALKNISDAPPLLSCLGHLHLANKSTVGIVGARNASVNGRRFAEVLATKIGAHNHVIASGLARGIDTSAHKGSIATGTIAAIAGGVDIIYPPENEALYNQIKEQGLIISEAPLGATPQARHFPRRNRIISGLSKGVIIIEAAIKSGSLITAHNALEQGREVFAVPGSPLDPRCHGPNNLIKDGAIVVTRAEDVLSHLESLDAISLNDQPMAPYKSISMKAISEEMVENQRQHVISLLSYEPAPIDEIARELEISAGIVMAVLLELELAGRIERHPGGKVSLLAQDQETQQFA